MDLVCPTCGTGFVVADANLPPGGGQVPCPTCSGMVRAAPVLELDLDAGPLATPELDIGAAPANTPELDIGGPATPELDLGGPAPATTPELDLGGPAPATTPELDVGGPAPATTLGGPAPATTPELDMGGAALATTPELGLGGPEPGASPTPELDLGGPELAMGGPPPTPELGLGGPAPATAEPALGGSPSPPELDLGGPAPAPQLDLAGSVSPPPELDPAPSTAQGPEPGRQRAPELEVAAQPELAQSMRAPAQAGVAVEQLAAPRATPAPGSRATPAPGSRATPAAGSRATPAAGSRATPASVRVSRPGMVVVSAGAGEHPWRLYAAIGGTAVAAILVVVIVSIVTSRPPAPPEMPNPLRARVAGWVAHGLKADQDTVEAAVRIARAGLEEDTHQGMRDARDAARSALIVDVDSAAAIAVYGHVLALWPDRVDRDDLDEALGAITSAVGEDPDSVHRPDLEDARAWLHLRNGKVEAARQAASRALDGAGTASARVTHAVARLRTRASEAAGELQAVVDAGDAPNHATLWLGEAYLRSADVARALRVWRIAQSGRPQDIGIMRRLARLSADVGDLVDAKARLEEIVTKGWASVEDRILLARIYSRAHGDSQLAFEQLDAGLADRDLSPLNRARLICEKASVVAVGRGARPSAKEVSGWLDTAFELAPDLPELLYVAGVIDEATGSYDNAIESLEAATDVAPERPEAAVVLALLLREEAPADARSAVNNAIEEAPHYVPLHLMLAVLELDAGNKTAAASAVRRALDYDPARSLVTPRLDPFFEPTSAHQRVGKLLLQKARGRDNPMLVTAAGVAQYFAGDLGKANGTLNRAVRSDSREVGARLYRALIALRRNKKGPAKRDLAAASDADRQHLVVRYYQARIAEMGRKTKGEAERIYRDLLDANPLDAAARVGLARALHARGAHGESRSEVLKVLTARPRDRGALGFLVESVRRSGGKKKRRR